MTQLMQLTSWHSRDFLGPCTNRLTRGLPHEFSRQGDPGRIQQAAGGGLKGTQRCQTPVSTFSRMIHSGRSARRALPIAWMTIPQADRQGACASTQRPGVPGPPSSSVMTSETIYVLGTARVIVYREQGQQGTITVTVGRRRRLRPTANITLAERRDADNPGDATFTNGSPRFR